MKTDKFYAIMNLYFEFIINMSEEQTPTTSTKWIDFSEEESQPDNSDSDSQNQNDRKTNDSKHNTNQNPRNNQASLEHHPENLTLDELEGNVWLLVTILGDNFTNLKQEIYSLKKQDQNIKVFPSSKQRNNNQLDLLIPKKMAQEFLDNGMNNQKSFKFQVHARNFRPRRPPRQYDDRSERRNGDRGGRRRGDGRRGGGRGGRRTQDGESRRGDRRDRDHKKPIYKDKQTGEHCDNRKKFQERMIQQKERHYSKKQAKQLGQQLGSFRNKPVLQRKCESEIQAPNDNLEEDLEIESKQLDFKKKYSHQPKREQGKQMKLWKRLNSNCIDQNKKQENDLPSQITSQVIDQNTTGKLQEKPQEQQAVDELRENELKKVTSSQSYKFKEDENGQKSEKSQKNYRQYKNKGKYQPKNREGEGNYRDNNKYKSERFENKGYGGASQKQSNKVNKKKYAAKDSKKEQGQPDTSQKAKKQNSNNHFGDFLSDDQ